MLPLPIHMEIKAGHLELPEIPSLGFEADFKDAARLVRDRLEVGCTRLVTTCDQRENVSIRIIRNDDIANDEGYRLAIDSDCVTLEASHPDGAYRGATTLAQLLGPDSFRSAGEPDRRELPLVAIEDFPTFRWRGVMVDLARHFVPKRELLALLDVIALHKFNVVQLHLTDDQGWRIETEAFPRLTEVGSWRENSRLSASGPELRDHKPDGGYYSKADLREIVAFAETRHLLLVPEVDMPGHMQAAIASYPEWGVPSSDGEDRPVKVWGDWGISEDILNVEDRTLDAMKQILDEVMEIFPGQYVGIGGDEAPKTQWKASASIARRIEEVGVKDVEDLQAWFTSQMSEHIRSRGRRVLGWDEIISERLDPSDTILAWRGTTAIHSAAELGQDVIACSHYASYLDYRQSEDPNEPVPVGELLTLRQIYAFTPIPPDLPREKAGYVLGGQTNIWTEYMDDGRQIEYHLFPRLGAMAEALWSGGKPGFDNFSTRLPEYEQLLQALGFEYRGADGALPWQRRPGIAGRPMPSSQRGLQQ